MYSKLTFLEEFIWKHSCIAVTMSHLQGPPKVVS